MRARVRCCGAVQEGRVAAGDQGARWSAERDEAARAGNQGFGFRVEGVGSITERDEASRVLVKH